jgi:hypothetical protein
MPDAVKCWFFTSSRSWVIDQPFGACWYVTESSHCSIIVYNVNACRGEDGRGDDVENRLSPPVLHRTQDIIVRSAGRRMSGCVLRAAWRPGPAWGLRNCWIPFANSLWFEIPLNAGNAWSRDNVKIRIKKMYLLFLASNCCTGWNDYSVSMFTSSGLIIRSSSEILTHIHEHTPQFTPPKTMSPRCHLLLPAYMLLWSLDVLLLPTPFQSLFPAFLTIVFLLLSFCCWNFEHFLWFLHFIRIFS